MLKYYAEVHEYQHLFVELLVLHELNFEVVAFRIEAIPNCLNESPLIRFLSQVLTVVTLVMPSWLDPTKKLYALKLVSQIQSHAMYSDLLRRSLTLSWHAHVFASPIAPTTFLPVLSNQT
jgi:hypothetical protein